MDCASVARPLCRRADSRRRAHVEPRRELAASIDRDRQAELALGGDLAYHRRHVAAVAAVDDGPSAHRAESESLNGRGTSCDFHAVRCAAMIRRLSTAWLGLLAVLLAGCATATVDKSWVRVTTPNYEVLSCAGTGETLALAKELEQMRAALISLTGSKPRSSAVPTKVYVFDSESYEAFRPAKDAVGYFLPGWRQNSVLLDTDLEYVSAMAVLRHEYVHELLNQSSVRYPLWYQEGLAEFLSTISISGGAAVIGAPPPRFAIARMQNSRTPRTGTHIPTIRQDRGGMPDPEKDSERFYAYSWALVSYLTLGHLARGFERDNRAGLAMFLTLYGEGHDEQSAIRQAFDRDLSAIDREVRAYVQRNAFPQVKIAVGTVAIDVPRPERMTQQQIAVELGDLARLMDLLDHAERFYEQALAIGEEPRALAGMAAILRRRDRGPEADRLFARALQQGPKIATIYIDFALRRLYQAEQSADQATATALTGEATTYLRRAIELQPQRPEAYVYLGLSAAFAKDAASQREALTALETAAAMLPTDAQVHYTLGMAYAAAGQTQRARDNLRITITAPNAGDLADLAREALDALRQP